MQKDKSWTSGIILAVSGISILHYVTGGVQQTDHWIFAKLYYIPLAVAALRYGFRGGILTALLIVAMYAPSLALRPERSTALEVDFALDLVVLTGVGVLVGLRVDREREQHRKAKEAERLGTLGQAAAMMAHEMKTPLVTMGGFARLLSRRAENESDRQRLDIVVAEVARLERLVHDALDFARESSLDLQRCRVQTVVRRAEEVIRPQAEAKGVYLTVRHEPEEAELACDSERLHQVLINLLDNAVQHTPDGGTVRLYAQVGGEEGVEFEIQDSGNGIPESLLDSVFEPFSSQRKGGTGLGLAIAQRIVRLHGGRIEAANRPEGGAVFRFGVPTGGPGGRQA